MHEFHDAEGRVWRVSVSIPARKRVREQTGFDILSVVTEEGMAKLSDPEILAGSLYAILEPEAKRLNVSPEDFALAIRGDSLETAVDALLKAIADFFPKGRRMILTALMEKSRQIGAATQRMVMAAIDALPTLPPSPPSASNA